MNYILVDTANLFFKSRHIASKRASDWEKIGFSLHLTLAGVNSIVKKLNSDQYHIVFCLEGRSWRKEYYSPYKANRVLAKQQLTEDEIEQDKMFWDTYTELITFVKEKTNVTVLRCENAEADDLIARFIALHPNDRHIISSSDSDFLQLIDDNVDQYNSMSSIYITRDGVFDDRNKRLEFTINSNSKLKVGKPNENFKPEDSWNRYALFLKCMRGDKNDNVFSAYPGVREKGTKTKIGLKEAYADRLNKGFSWNNMMLQRWVDHVGKEHRVLDDYERNKVLIDLTNQPENIKQEIDECVKQQLNKKQISNVGIHFLKFCGKYELLKLADSSDSISNWLNIGYKGSFADSK